MVKFLNKKVREELKWEREEKDRHKSEKKEGEKDKEIETEKKEGGKKLVE